MPERPGVLILDDGAELAKAAAAIFRESCASALMNSARGLFTVALSGGKTPLGLYSALSTPPMRDSIQWGKVHLFWGDERCVPPDSPESNYRTALVNLISNIDIPPENVHRVLGELDAATAASLYEEELRSFFKASPVPAFDLVLLGLGEDGHTLSLFPSSPALSEEKRLVTASKDPAGRRRVTLTLKAVNSASRAVFLVSGASKAVVLKEVLEGDDDKGYPASRVAPGSGELLWLVDREAAGLL